MCYFIFISEKGDTLSWHFLFSALFIYCCTGPWPPLFIIRNQFLIYWGHHCTWQIICLSCFQDFLFVRSFVMMCLGMDLFTYILYGACLAYWICRLIFSANLGSFNYYFLEYLFCFVLFLLSSCHSHNLYVGALKGIPNFDESVGIHPAWFQGL